MPEDVSNTGNEPAIIFQKPPADSELAASVNANPWILRKRMTYAAYAHRCAVAGRQPSASEWLEHQELTDEESQLLNDFFEAKRDSYSPVELADHFVIREYGNKARVGWFDERGELCTMSFSEFGNAHIEKHTDIGFDKDGKPRSGPLVPHWLKHPATRRYDRAEFLPGRDREHTPKDVVNLWRGWPHGLKPGWCDERLTPHGVEPDNATIFDGAEMPTGYCDLFQEHMLENMCGGDREVFQYLLAWMADAVWNPGPSDTAVILKGPQGSGKTFWAERFMEFFGIHALTLDSDEQLVGNFNKHLMNKSVVFADEAFFAGNRKHAAKLKTLVTRPDIFVEPKGVDGFVAKKMFRLIMASNDEHIIQAEKDDRRNFVLTVDATAHNQDREYFAKMAEEWSAGGRRALFRWLTGAWWGRAVGGGKFKMWRRPITAALDEQKNMSLPPAQRVIQNMLMEGEPPAEFVPNPEGSIFVATRLLAEASRLGTEHDRALGDCLRALAGKGLSNNVRVMMGEGKHRRQYRGFWLPPLQLCRERWEKHLERKIPWPSDVASWGVEEAQGEPVEQNNLY